MELQHGCRSEYGPLELRIQITSGLNGFTVYVEDPRLAYHSVVDEHEVLEAYGRMLAARTNGQRVH
jgi:hypothetical protein